MVEIDLRTIFFTTGFFAATVIPPVVAAGLVSFLRAVPQDSIIGTSSLTIMLSSIGIGLATFLAYEFRLDEKGIPGKAAFLALIIVIAWIIPLILVGTIPINEILERLSRVLGLP